MVEVKFEPGWFRRAAVSAFKRDDALEGVDRLAKFIMAEVPGEPSQSEGAVDTAIRVMRDLLTRNENLRWFAEKQHTLAAEAEQWAERLALALTRFSDPGAVRSRDTEEYCWLCGCSNRPEKRHEPNCIWVAAKRWLADRRIDRRDVFRLYGRHLPDCMMQTGLCTCGFEAVLQALEREHGNRRTSR